MERHGAARHRMNSMTCIMLNGQGFHGVMRVQDDRDGMMEITV
jgi:hypothetical protein